MGKYYIYYNPKSGNGAGKNAASKLSSILEGEKEFIDVLTLDGYAESFSDLTPDDTIVICGGDGTLNRFVNDTDGILPEKWNFVLCNRKR